jgi:predicted small integral membrane protein
MTSTRHTQEPTRSSSRLRLLGWTLFGMLLVGSALFVWFRSDSAPDLAWMAWTRPTAIFFITIVSLLLGMCIWEAFSPGGGPRVGILRFETTRGDRLFLSLLGSAFIHLAWLAFMGPDLWKALGVSVVYALLVFTLV